ncbi:MAG: hypothetical protein JSW63_12895 [Ignavibacterium sp.]|nr:MAG: hypothetical protein JSW63_12895 [Ignavibacterium sp.]
MKKLITYLFIFTLLFLFFACDKPAPTELIDDSLEELAEYEILGKDINDEFYSNGFDTSGVTQNLNRLPNLISLSGIKVTEVNSKTDEFSFAQAIFFDRSKPIFDSNNRLLAYHTFLPGFVRFDRHLANTVPFRIWYRDNGVLKDTLLGGKYQIFSGRHGNMHQYRHGHNSLINFRLNFFGQEISFDIPTPREITGNVELQGNRNNGDLRAVLRWDRGNTETVNIIIGGRVRNRDNVMPLYQVRTKDDGRLVVPPRFINQIPVQHFDKIVFTFIRRFERTFDDANNDLRVSSQSIHSIVVNLP